MLRSDEHVVPGDQWPIFLFAGYKYDAEDPWLGLLKSKLLVMVSKHDCMVPFTSLIDVYFRPISTSSPLLVRWNAKPRPHDQAMRSCMA